MTNNELNNGYIQLALNRMEDAKKHLQIVSNDLQRQKKRVCKGCRECEEKQRVITTLQDICRRYEARIKRSQTLARKRKNEKRRVVKIPLKSDLEWAADLVTEYGIQVLRDCRYNGNGIDSNAETSMEVAWACGDIQDKDRESFYKAIAKFAREHESETDQLIYKKPIMGES